MPVIRSSSQDSLTGLLSREAFYTRAEKAMAKGETDGLAAVYLRLLNVGAYNVRHGVAAGDEMVRSVAARLRETLSKQRVARLATGNFMALAPVDDVEDIVNQINRDLPTAGEADALVLKAGYCLLRDDQSLQESMVRARYAFDDIRYGSPAYSRFFDRGLETAYERRAYVVNHLDDAIERGEIRAFAQPIIRVMTGLICEVEILSRWESEEFGFLRPDEFVPELERNQLIHRLDAEVIRLACKQWAEAAALGANVPFGINLSRLDFELIDIFDVVTSAMRRYGVPTDQVHIEVTESAFSHNNELLLAGINRFRRAGFSLYLDDFGSGYSSLRVLEGTSFDVVKLDMSLLQEVEENERARVIVADAISMVKRLAMQTLCEGVETKEQFLFLKAVGCEKAQGYYFSKPLSHAEIMDHLSETAATHERPEDKRYLDSVGRVNLIDGTRSTVHGVEAAHFVGTQPFALVELRGERITFLSANTAFMRFAANSRAGDPQGIVERLGGELLQVRNKLLYAADKAMTTGQPQQFDFIEEGVFCTLNISHVESSEGRDAFLVEVLSVAKYSTFNDFRLLESSMRFLYTIFKRIDLLDVTDQTWRNIYLNVPRYNALRAGDTPQDEIEAFGETFIHPDDRAGFLEFYDLDTVDERVREAGSTHVASTFYALAENDRYEEQIFTLIPSPFEGHRRYLSCMRAHDYDGGSHEHLSGNDKITDTVLLSGMLGVTDRNIFWKDTRRRFVGANQAFLEYYGFGGVDEILGKTDEDLGWGKRNGRFLDDERRVLSGIQVLDVSGYTERGGELRDMRISRMPLFRNGEVIGLVGYFTDEGHHESSSLDRRRDVPDA